MIVEDTKDLVETDDYVIIEATLSEGDLLFVQIAVGIRNEVGDIVRIIPISTNPNLTKRPGSYPPGYFYAHFCYFRGVGGVLR